MYVHSPLISVWSRDHNPDRSAVASVESPMLQAIYNGMLDDGLIEPLSPTCTTGNCTFEAFNSLGFCSECCDVRPIVERDCQNNSVVATCPYSDCGANDTVTSCTYRFPGGVDIIFNNTEPLKLMEVFTMPLNTTFPSNIATCDINGLGNAVASFGLMEVEPNVNIGLKQAQFCALFPCVQRHRTNVLSGVPSSTIVSSWRESGDNAYVGDPAKGAGQIEIWNDNSKGSPDLSQKLRARSTPTPSSLPRIIKPEGGIPDQPNGSTVVNIGFNYSLNYPAVVADPSLAQGLFNNVSSLFSRPLNLSNDDVQVAYLQPRNTLSDANYITTLATIYFPTSAISRLRRLLQLQSSDSSQPSTSDPASQSLQSMIQYSYTQVPWGDNSADISNSYLISQKRFFALNVWFADAFTGTVSQSYDLFRGVYSLDQITASSDLMSVIYSHGNITMTMDNLATSMSNYIRSSSGIDNAMEGSAYNMETFVHVRWVWLSLLVICVLGTLCFLLCAIVNTKRHGSGIAWKSSALAAMFHGLDEAKSGKSLTGRPGQIRCVSEMENLARSIHVRLAEDVNGNVKLRRQPDEVDR